MVEIRGGSAISAKVFRFCSFILTLDVCFGFFLNRRNALIRSQMAAQLFLSGGGGGGCFNITAAINRTAVLMSSHSRLPSCCFLVISNTGLEFSLFWRVLERLLPLSEVLKRSAPDWHQHRSGLAKEGQRNAASSNICPPLESCITSPALWD